ncbi:sugar transferase [Tessaracoccus flavus]|nr:sugar transferase [Tessaracoccus flavus]
MTASLGGDALAPNRPVFLLLKRTADVVLASTALVVLSPVMGLTALAIEAGSAGPAIFSQERLGLGARAFRMYKFRTMNVGAESGGVYEAAGDQRVTRVGRFLRRTSLDELPQLVNIVRGDMSIVGPRPTLTYHPWP